MSQFTSPSSTAREQAQAYTEAILGALGERDPLQVLREMPAAVHSVLSGLNPIQILTPEAPGKWSMGQVVQHLADSDTVGAFRFRMVIAQDRPSLPGYDQDLWVERLHRNDTDIDAAVAEFTAARRASIRLLERTVPEDWKRVAVHSERGEESLLHLVRMHAGHDVVHLRQLQRIRVSVLR